MAKIILKEIAKIVIVVVKSYCGILVLAVMVTVRRSYSAVTNAVATINDRWPAVILIAGVESQIDFRTQCVIMTDSAGGLTLMKFRKILEFQSSWIVMNCQWILYLLSLFPATAYKYRRTLWKNHPFVVSSFKKTTTITTTNTNDKTTEIRNIKSWYPCII